MKKFFIAIILFCSSVRLLTADESHTINTLDLEKYGAIFRQALHDRKVPIVNGGIVNYYELEVYFSTLNPKEANKIAAMQKKMRKAQYSEIASILYYAISQQFDIPYDPQKLNTPDQFFTSSVGLHLLVQVMNQYVTDDGRLDKSLLVAILDLFSEDKIVELSEYLRPVMMKSVAADLMAYPFKKDLHRQQILNRVMGVLMFAYYHPSTLRDDEIEIMWREVQANEKNIIHKFVGIDYEFYSRLMNKGSAILGNLTYAGNTKLERDYFNAFLLKEIFHGDRVALERTAEASRAFLRSDQLEKKIFYPY